MVLKGIEDRSSQPLVIQESLLDVCRSTVFSEAIHCLPFHSMGNAACELHLGGPADHALVLFLDCRLLPLTVLVLLGCTHRHLLVVVSE
jgi:hypothetical protein